MSKMNRVRPRLGRGLDSLISMSVGELETAGAPPAVEERIAGANDLTAPPATVAEPTVKADRVREVPVSAVRPNPHQPRREFSDGSLNDLAASLKTNGLIQPIVVRQVTDGYELIAGERRLRAAKLAGLITLPAIIKEVDGLTQAQMALVENIQREDLNPLDRATAYRTLLDQLGLTQAELSARLGEDRSVIANHVRLLELAQPVRDAVRAGKLSLGHAKLLAGVSDILRQEQLAHLVLSQDLSVRSLEKVVQDEPKPTTKPKEKASAHIADLEKNLSRQLGMRVQVRSGSKGKGRLVIHYSSLDQFDDVMHRLGVKTDE